MSNMNPNTNANEITKILDEMGIPAELNGYAYLHKAISLAVDDSNVIFDIAKLYDEVANEFATTAGGVAAAMRKAIGIAWDRGDVDVLISYFSYTIQNNRGKPTNTEFIAMIAERVSLQQENDALKTRLANVLHQLGVPADIKGYGYLRSAILLTVEDSDIIQSPTKVLYPTVAKQYGTTASRVEGAIRKAIEIAWDRGDVDLLNSYFGFSIQNCGGIPSNTEFIAMIADNLRLRFR